MGDMPDYHQYVVPVSVEVPAAYAPQSDIAEYDSTPEDIEDESRGPILVDIKGRVYVRVYSGTIEVEQDTPADLQATVTQADKERTVDHTKIKGTALKSPTVAASVPISIENDAIAYNATDDLFKVELYYSAAAIDPRATRALTASDIVTVVQDTPGSHLIRVYGNTVKDGSGTDYALLVDSDGKLIISPLSSATSSIEVVQDTAADLKATVTQAEKDREISDVTKTASVATSEATSSGNTEIITVTAGKKLRIKTIDIWNNGSAAITVALRLTSTGTLTYKKKIAKESGWILNLIGANWEGGTDEDLFINLSADGTVSYTISYEEI